MVARLSLFLRSDRKRAVLIWLGGGVSLAPGGWDIFADLDDHVAESPKGRTITIGHNMQAGHDVTLYPTLTIGPSDETFKKDRIQLRAFAKKVVFLALALPLASPASALPPASETGACSLENAVPATVAAVDEDFDLLLDDGRRAALTGLEFPPQGDNLRADARKRLSDWLAGRDVFLGPQGPAPDRWGRSPARVFAPGEERDGPLVSVGAALLEEGLARFRPDSPAADCARPFLGAEAPAREAKRGLWARQDFAPIDAGAIPPQRKGMMVVEGVIHSVGETPRAIYLNFGEKRKSDFSVVISRRNLAMFSGSGIDPLTLGGRRARVRGLIETGFGPRIEIASPAEIELIDAAAQH